MRWPVVAGRAAPPTGRRPSMPRCSACLRSVVRDVAVTDVVREPRRRGVGRSRLGRRGRSRHRRSRRRRRATSRPGSSRPGTGTSTRRRRAWTCGWARASGCTRCSRRSRRAGRCSRSGCRASRPFTLDELDAAGFFGGVGLDRIRDLVARRANLLITGAGGSGKTTLLSALLAAGAAARAHRRRRGRRRAAHRAPARRRAREHGRRTSTAPGRSGSTGWSASRCGCGPTGSSSASAAGAELRELLGALNTGHDGGAGTLHANSLADVPARLEALGSLAGMTVDAVARQSVERVRRRPARRTGRRRGPPSGCGRGVRPRPARTPCYTGIGVRTVTWSYPSVINHLFWTATYARL